MAESNARVAKEMILSAPLEKLGKVFLEDLFAAHHDKEKNEFVDASFKPTDVITLTKEEYKWIKEPKITTTLGKLFFNRYILEKTGIIEHIGYLSDPINKDNLGKLSATVNTLAVLDKITTIDIGNYIDSRDRLGFWCSAFLSVSITASLIRPMDNVNKRKAELFKQYEAQLNSDNAVTQVMAASEIETELMGMVKDNLKADSGYDLYASGDGNLNNNYKTINVMRGAVFNDGTKKYDVVEASLMNGIDKKDITAFSNSVLSAAYPSAVGTADAGYMSKILLAVLQSEEIDPDPESDCGTQVTIPFTVTKKSKQYCTYRYINENGKRILTTDENITNYMGKVIHMYSPQCCLHDKICGKCAGRVFYNLGAKNIGLMSSLITQKLLNLKLKSKHDLSQNAGIIPEDRLFLDKNNYCTIENGILKNKTKMRCFIPRMLEELDEFYKESSELSCMGIFPVKFYDKNDNEIFSTRLTAPAVLTFNLYSEVQEDPDNYIITYEPNSEICSLGIQKKVTNVEFFINQIFLYSKSPQLPYHLMADTMFNCMEINATDLTGISMVYELMARRLCRNSTGEHSFAIVYGKGGVDPMSYKKMRFREAVQQEGALQGILFQDISKSMLTGLANTLNGKKQIDTPLEKVIKA